MQWSDNYTGAWSEFCFPSFSYVSKYSLFRVKMSLSLEWNFIFFSRVVTSVTLLGVTLFFKPPEHYWPSKVMFDWLKS